MSTKTLILVGSRILEIWALFSVSRSPHSAVDSITVRPLSSSPSLSLPLQPLHLVASLWDALHPSAIPSAIPYMVHTRLQTSYAFPLDAVSLDSWITLRRSLRHALLLTDWLKCTWHLILKVYKHFNIQKLFFARVKLNNSYYVYKIPSMKNKGLSKLIKKEVLQKS